MKHIFLSTLQFYHYPFLSSEGTLNSQVIEFLRFLWPQLLWRTLPLERTSRTDTPVQQQLLLSRNSELDFELTRRLILLFFLFAQLLQFFTLLFFAWLVLVEEGLQDYYIDNQTSSKLIESVRSYLMGSTEVFRVRHIFLLNARGAYQMNSINLLSLIMEKKEILLTSLLCLGVFLTLLTYTLIAPLLP